MADHFGTHQLFPLLKYMISISLHVILYVNTVFRKFTRVNLRTLTERHVITFQKQLINFLYQPAWAILVKLGEINMTHLIILSKIQSFITPSGLIKKVY
jgi:hypothetical protein